MKHRLLSHNQKVRVMSEEVEQNEIGPEEARQDAIRDMMDKWADGNLTDAQDSFNSIMNVRADSLVADRKADIAASIYNNVGNESPEDASQDWPEEMTGEVQETESEEPEEA